MARERLIAMLDSNEARYRLLPHPPEGRTEVASRLRRHQLAQAAKCIVIRVALDRKARQYVLAVVAGDRYIDLDRVRRLLGGTKALFAQRTVAERLAGSESGTIVPFAFDPELALIVDHGLLAHDEIYFNAARLDESIVLNTRDYLRLAQPRIEFIRLAEGRSGDAHEAPMIAAPDTAAASALTVRRWA
jgi:Ala-tRNA(Pro) deacylase